MDRVLSAIIGSRVSTVASALRGGLSPNTADENGTTLLYQAAVQGETEIVRMLPDAGADPNQESHGLSEGLPLCAAACRGHTELVRLLLDRGADPNGIENGPMTALAWARWTKHPDTVELLLERGASLDPIADAAPPSD